MIEETRYKVAIDRCQRCQGYWFDIDEIQKYLHSRGLRRGQWVPSSHELQDVAGGEPVECTCCGRHELREHQHRGVLFRGCSWCGGTFLPESELAKFKVAAHEDSDPPPLSLPIPTIEASTPFDVFDLVPLVIEAVFHVALD